MLQYGCVNIDIQTQPVHHLLKSYWDTQGDSRFVTSRWEEVLLCNDVSHWLGTNLESALDTDDYADHIAFIIPPALWHDTVVWLYIWAADKMFLKRPLPALLVIWWHDILMINIMSY